MPDKKNPPSAKPAPEAPAKPAAPKFMALTKDCDLGRKGAVLRLTADQITAAPSGALKPATQRQIGLAGY